jgi:hypothetical protein
LPADTGLKPGVNEMALLIYARFNGGKRFLKYGMKFNLKKL